MEAQGIIDHLIGFSYLVSIELFEQLHCTVYHIGACLNFLQNDSFQSVIER